MHKMKMLFIVLGIITLTTMTGCDNTADQEELMKKYGTDYYNTYMSGVKGLDIAEVTLGMLKDLNEKELENYDLKEFEGCKDETSVKMTLDKETNKIKKYEYNLKCKK